jgi:CobQ-like glutamine amidotransferase family enzyme
VTTICLLYPELLGTYGDVGNGLVALERARRRGLDAELVSVGLNDRVPDASLYLLGGGEDGPQRLAADLLRASSFGARVRDGAHVLAVCAGLQILGLTFCVEGDDEYEGLGLVDVVTSRGERRSVGELATRVDGRLLVGFENHGGRTTLHGGVDALGSVVKGRGNDAKLDGYRTKNIWATYAHGPVLAMNPWFCDEILAAVTGTTLEPLSSAADRLYEERCRVLSA